MNDVGLYTAAYRFLFLGMILVDSFINSLFPVISNMFSNARESFEKACRKSLQLLFIITIPIAVSLSLLARPIVLFLYGAKLEQSAEVLKWLIWVIVPYGVSQIFGYAMVASKRQNFDLMVNALGMIVNFALNWIFIHTYGYMGAAYAGLCSIGIYVLLQLPIIVSRIIVVKISRFVADVAKILGAALFMVGFILIFQRQNFIGVSMASFLVYGLALIGFGAFSKSDKDMIIKFLGKSQ